MAESLKNFSGNSVCCRFSISISTRNIDYAYRRYARRKHEQEACSWRPDGRPQGEQLRKRGYTPVLLPDDFKIDSLPKGAGGPNKPKYDFSSLRGKYQIDELVYVQITQLGISRNYASYVPTGAPQATVLGQAYMVKLADNSFDWYATIRQERGAAGQWDEAPNYPGLTNAYFQAVEGARDEVLKPFND